MNAESRVGVALLNAEDPFDGVERRSNGAIGYINSELFEEGQIFI